MATQAEIRAGPRGRGPPSARPAERGGDPAGGHDPPRGWMGPDGDAFRVGDLARAAEERGRRVRARQIVRREAFVVMLPAGAHDLRGRGFDYGGVGAVLRPGPRRPDPITLGEYSACQELVRADHDFRAGLGGGASTTPAWCW